MRMLVIVDKYLPTDHSFVEGVLATSLPKLGVSVTFLGFSTSYSGRMRIGSADYRLVKPWPGGLFIEALQMLVTFPFFMWRAERYDAVFTRNDPIALILGRLYRVLRNRRARHLHQVSNLHAEAILQSDNFSIWYKIASLGDLLIRKLFLQKVTHIFAVSERMKNDLRARYPSVAERVDWLPLGVLKEDFAYPMDYRSRPNDVAYIGTLAASRRLDVVVDAVEVYNQRYGPLRLKIWGSSHNPKDDRKLIAYVRRKGLKECVQFFGRVPRKQMVRELMTTKIGLCTIPPEGLFQQSSPAKLMEFLAAGCCVIATRGIPDQDSIIKASGGGLLVDFKADAIAAGIHQLLSQPDQAAQMSAKGRAYILKHRDYVAMARKIQDAAVDAVPR